jgi:uncharacterized protein (TIGR03437 family)
MSRRVRFRRVNAASLQTGPLVAGSLATLFGSSLSGNDVAAIFDNTAVQLFSKSPTQFVGTVYHIKLASVATDALGSCRGQVKSS